MFYIIVIQNARNFNAFLLSHMSSSCPMHANQVLWTCHALDLAKTLIFHISYILNWYRKFFIHSLSQLANKSWILFNCTKASPFWCTVFFLFLPPFWTGHWVKTVIIVKYFCEPGVGCECGVSVWLGSMQHGGALGTSTWDGRIRNEKMQSL